MNWKLTGAIVLIVAYSLYMAVQESYWYLTIIPGLLILLYIPFIFSGMASKREEQYPSGIPGAVITSEKSLSKKDLKKIENQLPRGFTFKVDGVNIDVKKLTLDKVFKEGAVGLANGSLKRVTGFWLFNSHETGVALAVEWETKK